MGTCFYFCGYRLYPTLRELQEFHRIPAQHCPALQLIAVEGSVDGPVVRRDA